VIEQAHRKTRERWSVVGGAGHGGEDGSVHQRKARSEMNQTGPVDGWIY